MERDDADAHDDARQEAREQQDDGPKNRGHEPGQEQHEGHAGHQGHGAMGLRGVSRPMAEQMAMGGHHQHGGEEEGTHEHSEHGSSSSEDESASHHSHSGSHSHGDSHDQPASSHGHGGHGGHSMSKEQRQQMLHMHHQNTLWVYWTLIMLAFWLLCAPFTFGYLDQAQWVDPSGGRGVWFSEQTHTALRASLTVWNDLLCGLVLLCFGWRGLQPNRPISLWICCFVGVWLTMAPVFLWAPTTAAYLNDTIVGAWVIALTILIPGMPNMIMYMQMGPPTPPGWSYNPSSWPQRWIMIATGFAGWLCSRYLAMFQLGYITEVKDPFFGFLSGTEPVLNSKMSHAWPISDAGLGGISYTFEFLMGFMGSPSRWRTMPWMVAFFGVLVIPLGLTHILLVISQPVIVHHWCTFCLLAAAIMLPMIPLEVDEVVAMFQHMRQAYRRGDRGGSLWKIFWKGGKAEDCQPDQRSPQLMELPQRPWQVFLASIWGMSFPWTLTVSTLLGIWLMFVPTLFGLDIKSHDADIFHLGGALVVTVAVICMGEVIRIGRYLNVVLGLIIAIAPWFFGDSTGAYLVGAISGIAVAALAIPRGVVHERFGAWDKWVR